jgi:hypothetical protein
MDLELVWEDILISPYACFVLSMISCNQLVEAEIDALAQDLLFGRAG